MTLSLRDRQRELEGEAGRMRSEPAEVTTNTCLFPRRGEAQAADVCGL